MQQPTPLTRENVDAALERCREFLGPYDRDNVFIDFEGLSVEAVRDLHLLANAYVIERSIADRDTRDYVAEEAAGVVADVKIWFRPGRTNRELALFDVRFGFLRRTAYQEETGDGYPDGSRFAVYAVPQGRRDHVEIALDQDEDVHLYSFDADVE